MAEEMRPGTSHQDDETVDDNLTHRLLRGHLTAANDDEAGGRLSDGTFRSLTNVSYHTEKQSRLCHGERSSAFLRGWKGKKLSQILNQRASR